MANRVNAFRSHMQANNWPAALVTNLTDLRWLSGFSGSNAALLVTLDEQRLVTDFRYRTQVAQESPGWTVSFQATGERLLTVASRLAGELDLATLAVQADHMAWSQALLLGELLPSVELLPARKLLGELRTVKDESELASIEAAAALADQVVDRALRIARVGITEVELRVALEVFMLEIGSERPAFDLIVGSGPNSAKCHARPGSRRLDDGDLVVLDLGCVVEGYHSDITRTFAIGSAPAAAQRIYEVVYEALQAGLAAMRPGAPAREVDAAARDVIEAAGHGNDFGHGLGHGVGLEIHEEPRLSPTSDDVLRFGQIVTVEPGVYVEGLGGVRLEQLCRVGESGAEVLSLAPCPPALACV